MKHVAILLLDDTPLSSVALPADILNHAGVMWNRIAGLPCTPLFTVSLVSQDGAPVHCHRTVEVIPNGSLQDIGKPDIVIVGALLDLQDLDTRYDSVIRSLRALHDQGVIIASICSAAFLLAAAGLLDGKSATTHWGMKRQFTQMFPHIRLETDRTVTDAGTVLCSGGAHAGADLALYIIRKYCGAETANRCARTLLLDPQRSRQSPYEIMNIRTDHGDTDIARVQDWIATNYNTTASIDILADIGNMSRRTFERRFKRATGESPHRYLQSVRIEMAKLMLETVNTTFEDITRQVGYEDTSSFRRIFQKNTGLPPTVYREKFQREPNATQAPPDKQVWDHAW